MQPLKNNLKHPYFFIALVVIVSFILIGVAISQHKPWVELFNHKDIKEWKAGRFPDSFSVENGLLKTTGEKGLTHLFYIGPDQAHPKLFKNFELKATLMTTTLGNSGIFFHTDFSTLPPPDFRLAKGYEVQVESNSTAAAQTGSLHDIVDIHHQIIPDYQWFQIHLIVQGKHIQIFMDDKKVIDYYEPEHPIRTPDRKERLLDPNGGFIAIQGHNNAGPVYYKDIVIRELP